ncbi:uncharacterized protein PAC_13751 [Phialocephala subalpina]|uniref:Uncharacterized protein n=1 Tax=Phialocephala subalpina TaxID=576137 RepID=A0A1L7XFQ1_9HELO|nr:uncharacterized protein PAC_13751 [Phialocephala subalpina]
MRLINVNTYETQEFIGTNIPPYAILSHTWGSEEVSFQDWQDTSRRSQKAGFAKIQGACDQAREDGLEYVWVDTNCIDKTSSAELSEAINSMFAWYRDATQCYVYLADVPDTAATLNSDRGLDEDDLFCRSKWFKRGWTLQELLAPEVIVFFSQDWKSIGIFEINIPLLYGEGQRAFVRLQEEILRTTDDQSLFCWEWNKSIVPKSWTSILAPCPAVFECSGDYSPTTWADNLDVVPYNITNVGLSIKLPFIQTGNSDLVLAILQVDQATQLPDSRICIPLAKRGRVYYRLPFPTQPTPLHVALAGPENHIFVISKPGYSERDSFHSKVRFLGFATAPEFDIGFLLTFETIGNGPFTTKFGYRTLGAAFNQSQSVLGFTFVNAKAAENAAIEAVAAGIFDVIHDSLDKFVVILAIKLRQAADGSRTFKYYCQVVPQQVVNSHRLPGYEDLVHQAEGRIMDIKRNIDFSSDSGGEGTVVLGNVIHYSTTRYDARQQFVRVVHIVSGDERKNEKLKDGSESSISLFD